MTIPPTKPIPTPDEVREFLVSLGATEDEVATSVIAAGIKETPPGTREFREVSCPIAALLKQRFRYEFSVSVTVKLYGVWSDDQFTITPGAVMTFIATLDMQRARLMGRFSTPLSLADVHWPELYSNWPTS